MSTLDNLLAFVARPEPCPEVRINFGMFAGRGTTPAEIDELARLLMPEFEGSVSIVAEERHELSRHSEGSIHLVRIELPEGADETKVIEIAEFWARACINSRNANVPEL